ncbi:inter-alpha-trypsin inhibitor heavy chain H1-like [Panicum miliaceum]|uniref:Inter-alpha-trypsin inhibitor heavy chain H1-like n=1 Tax=Panicum miliaceum TaxID=4540 RepID=A0A3L6RJ94_PANMI|nr:inter-alpha-trypsin inhibitor heavy chain H1-like [Panicum miliaceum]
MPTDTKVPLLAAPPAGVYQDDEPLEPRTAQPAQAPAATNGGGMVLTTQCEFPALGRGASRDAFAVLVHARAPADVARAPIDLVAVLDVSSSMHGHKLALLKQAVGFVVDQLGPDDRLSVVAFSARASRVTRLARMSAAGKAAAKRAVGSLAADRTGTSIVQGLRVGAQVLAGRRHRNAVASVILLSDGKDRSVRPDTKPAGVGGKSRSYADLVPPSFAARAGGGSRPAPIHTFGFGASHDAAAMHAVAEATGGTFSFVENHSAIQDSFARCVGGLLSVAVQEARIAVACLHRGVRVQRVKSGCYASHVAADGRAASIDVGELYDDEGRRFLVLVYVPRARATEEVTRLVKVSCTYRDTATGQAAHVTAPAALIQRPLELTCAPAPSMDVERERVRVAATEDIAAARVKADGGGHTGAAQILDSRLRAVERSAPGATGDDPTCEALKEELRDLSARVGDPREYKQTGRACLLAGMSSHAQQRASGVELQSTASKLTRAYLTPKMEEMVEISRESRKRGNDQQTGGGSRQVKRIKEELS